MKGKLLRKLCAISLSALMVGGAGLAEVGSFAFASLSVSAAETTEATPASSFVYAVNEDGTVRITKFKGMDASIQDYKASGRALKSGIYLNNLFLGTGYNSNIRIPLDFGSDMYEIRLTDKTDKKD